MSTIDKKPTVAVVESKRISLFRNSKKKKSSARKKKKQEQEFKLWYNGISVSIFRDTAIEDEVYYHISIIDENNGYNCLFDEWMEGFSKSVEKAISFLSEYSDTLQKSSEGVKKALDKLSQAFLEGSGALTEKEKEQMEFERKKDNDGLESMFEESFMENL